MASAALELQKAVFAALIADTALTAALGGERVYDAVPPNAAFPYISFGRTSGFDWSTGTENGAEQLFTLHVWSKARGKTEVLEIMELARARIEDDGLTGMAGYNPVSVRLEFAEARYDEDLAVHHGLLRFRVLIEEAAA